MLIHDIFHSNYTNGTVVLTVLSGREVDIWIDINVGFMMQLSVPNPIDSFLEQDSQIGYLNVEV